MVVAPRYRSSRNGGVYIAVLGTSLIIALLGLSALIGQRIQNRIVTAAADIRQAQMNANAAAEMGLLIMKQDPNWRTNQADGDWFTDRATGAGTCSLNVVDPLDGNLANDPDDSVVVLAVGHSGKAQQRVRLTIDPRQQPLSCLRSAIAAGNAIDLQGDTLRTNGLITANQISASSSQVYGTVEAVTITGSTYNGTATQVTSGSLPTMPNWSSVFNYYRTNGTEITISSLPNVPTANFARNGNIENGATDWTGAPPGTPSAQISQSNNYARSPSNSLRVQNRTDWQAGAAQRIEHFVKPGHQYTIDVYVMLPVLSLVQDFRLGVYVKGTGDASAQFVYRDISVLNLLSLSWAPISGTFTVPNWTGDLEYAFIKVAGASSGNTADFFVDDLTIRDSATGKFIYRQVLSPNVNPFGTGQTNPEGIYWINCNGSRLYLERCRILGTLLIINPGANSCIANGPIHWSPAVPGYPAILVDADTATNADFAIYASNRALSEKENNVNFNPAGVPHPDFGQDADLNDHYESVIRGMIAIEDGFTYQNRPFIRGQILVGGDISGASGTLDVEFSPESLLSPPPGFLGPYSHLRRPASAHKAVLP